MSKLKARAARISFIMKRTNNFLYKYYISYGGCFRFLTLIILSPERFILTSKKFNVFQYRRLSLVRFRENPRRFGFIGPSLFTVFPFSRKALPAPRPRGERRTRSSEGIGSAVKSERWRRDLSRVILRREYPRCTWRYTSRRVSYGRNVCRGL